MNNDILVTLLLGGIAYGTPLLLAGLGELLAERGGVLNLGIEGMMLIGAAAGFWTVQAMSGPTWIVLLISVIVAALAGAAAALLFAIVCFVWRGNQVVAGLALTIFGGAAGLSSFLASEGHLAGVAAKHQFANLNIAGLKHVSFFGPVILDQNALVYFSWALTIAVALYLYHTRYGLHLRAVGEDPAAADAMGVNVSAYRYTHTIVGGALAGIGGAFYSEALTPNWSNGLTAGAGWIALGLVIFAFWKPGLLLIGSYLFGIVTSLGFTLQSRGVHLPPELFSALPYIAVVIVLVAASSIWRGRRLGAPSALGSFYSREG
ncbi:MAG: ABC transporter permease [Acidimicrobiales bacterium]